MRCLWTNKKRVPYGLCGEFKQEKECHQREVSRAERKPEVPYRKDAVFLYR